MILPDDLPWSVTPSTTGPSDESADRASAEVASFRRRSESEVGADGRARAQRRERVEPTIDRSAGGASGEAQPSWLGFRQSASGSRAQGRGTGGVTEVGSNVFCDSGSRILRLCA